MSVILDTFIVTNARMIVIGNAKNTLLNKPLLIVKKVKSNQNSEILVHF